MRNKPKYDRLLHLPQVSYGRLYNWFAVATGKLAPVGYTIPTDANWTTLINYINTTYNVSPNDFGVGNHLKSQRQDGSNNANVIIKTTTDPYLAAHITQYGRDTVKLSLLAGGIRGETSGEFALVRESMIYWTSDAVDANNAYCVIGSNALSTLTATNSRAKKRGAPVRFMRAASTFEQSQFADGAFVGQVHDLCGNVYDLVKIGTQVWSVQNLACMRYNDGTSIPTVETGDGSSAAWVALETGAYCNYNNDEDNVFLGLTVKEIWKTLRDRAI